MEPLARTLDAAILRPEFTLAETRAALKLCLQYNTITVCVRPCDIAVAKEMLAGSQTGVCVVLGFPHGDQLSASKADEARRYIDMGVHEIDMVSNFGRARSGEWEAYRDDIGEVAELTRKVGIPLKVIGETVHLDPEQVRRFVETSIEAGADYVKTSTGFNGAGADPETVRLMIATAAGRIRIKPSGGIRDATTARAFLEMGAHRLGVGYSNVAALCGEGEASGDAY